MSLTVRGLPACICQTLWFPVFDRECRELGLVKEHVDLMQLIGGAPASKGYHLGGGSADWRQTDPKIAQLARSMGAPATWVRDGSRDSFDNNQHTHSVLRGCQHLSDGAQYQIAEVDAGGDGLSGGVPDDPELKPFLTKRTWQQGIAWAEKRQKDREQTITFGTHNTLDGAGRETPFADVIIFTEALAREVRAELSKTHQVWVCKQQRDLVLAVHKRLNPLMVKQDYRLANLGIAKVTPKRGTWRTDLLLLGVRTSGIWEHRINAAFPPFIRGEKQIRSTFWKRHTKLTCAMIRAAKPWATVVLAGGDPNTPRHITAYGESLRSEVGEGKDRLGSNREITDVEELSKAGSDHHRLRGSVRL